MIIDDRHNTTPLKPCSIVPLRDSAMDREEHTVLGASESGCLGCPSRSSCIVKQLDKHDILRFERIVHHEKPKRKAKHLYWQDAAFKSIYIVRSGAVKTYRISENGRERVLGFHLPGEMVGLDGFYKNRYSTSAVALDTTAVCELSYEKLSALLTQTPDLLRHFLSIVYSETIAEQKKHFLDSKTVEEQVAAFILDLSARYRRRKLSGMSFQLSMTRRDIANYLGMAMESVSRVLTRFQQRGWVEIHGHEITISDSLAIRNLLTDYNDELTQ